jgi:hypothetical protein
MNCKCKNKGIKGEEFVCNCDRLTHPIPLNIGAGLVDLPRQIAGFPEFRRAMLYELGQKPSLKNWNARDEGDLGIMLLEMWAYVCDLVSFYDKVKSEEAYLRTANRRPSLRKLIGILGYLPRPAIAATVKLAALADGRKSILIPSGTAFQSTGFEGNPPQVFEVDEEHTIHPLTSQWDLKRPKQETFEQANPNQIFISPSESIATDIDLFLLNNNAGQSNRVVEVESTRIFRGNDNETYTEINLKAQAGLTGNTVLNQVKVYEPRRMATPWLSTGISIGSNTIVLDNIYRQISFGDFILVKRNQTNARWFRVIGVGEAQRSYLTTGTLIRLTIITLDTDLNDNSRKAPTDNSNWTDSIKTQLKVHFNMRLLGRLANPPQETLDANDPIIFDNPQDIPIDGFNPNSFLLEDKNLNGQFLTGALNSDYSTVTPDVGQSWSSPLQFPVSAFGNVLYASRGESVQNEILGSGSAASQNQTFTLKKRPLTYLFIGTGGNAQGLKNTLTVFVDGVQWTEVPSFFGKGPEDEVFIVRQNDDEESQVTFGDGIRGKRLPTGVDNVVANYRFGAGAVSPPSGSIDQISNPIEGLSSIQNPVAASGGTDRESANNLRYAAPKSALLLGRAISLVDMEVVVAEVPGVSSVKSEWRWHGTQQRTAAYIWYIGDPGLESLIRERLTGLIDPTTPIQIEPATPISFDLRLDLEIDNRYNSEEVITEVRSVLTNSTDGLLLPSNIGIGQAIFRSQILEAVLAVEGTICVKLIQWDNIDFTDFGKALGAGNYFLFNPNGLIIN